VLWENDSAMEAPPPIGRRIDGAAILKFHENVAVLEVRTRALAERLDSLRAQNRARRARFWTGRTGTGTPLSDRELMILKMIAEGRENAEIATALHFGLGTIKQHVRGILDKLGARTRAEAAVRAVRAGLI